MNRWLGTALAAAAACGMSGCASGSGRAVSTTAPASTRPTTSATEAEAVVTAGSYERLWEAAADAARDRLFTIDRRDYRGGVLTTEPLVSAQFFEPWRRDTLTADAVTESSLATIRRTIRFEFTPHDSGTFSVRPHVSVERYSAAERRLTSAMMYRSAFRKTTATGTRETDRGVQLPVRYWYRIGDDPVLEKDLADAIRRRLESIS